MLSTKLFRFVRTLHILAAALTLCGLQMQAQPLSRKDWVDLAKARAGRQASSHAAASSPKADGTYITVDVPNSCGTTLEGINSRGDIIGAYLDCAPPFHGHNFLWSNGVFTYIDPPGCFGDSGFASTEMGINAPGDIVGSCVDSNGLHGFLLSKGSYTILDAPGAAGITIASGINPKGDIVGTFTDSNGNGHGFLLSEGEYSIFDVAGAAPPAQTWATAINPNGDILGTYEDQTLPGAPNTGFLLSVGVFSTFKIPGEVTFPNGMNPRGDIVGLVCCGTGPSGSFLLSNGVKAIEHHLPFDVTTFDAPGACSGCTFAYDINPQGDIIVGFYYDNNFNMHGFLLMLKKN